jgi:hypothetical protein
MSRRHLKRIGPGPLELIEEAVHLLRVVPGAVLGCYYLGSLPFVLGLLYFWADMSRGATAYEHCVPAAFAVALLFLWMKTWQAIFARHLKAQIAGRSAAALTLPGFFRTATNQTILQPSGLFLLPLALLIVLPFGWFYAFYQSVTAFGAEDGVAAKHVFRRAAQQAQLWPRQNHLLLGALLVFGLVVFLDVAIGLATIPALLKMFFGIETAFTRSFWAVLNTTFVATAGALTYLCLDPLVKAVYLLRCFYGESLHTGEDLRAELRRFVPGVGAAAMVLLVALNFPGLAETHSAKIEDPLEEVFHEPLEAPPGFGVRQSSGALAMEASRLKAPEDWRSPRRYRAVRRLSPREGIAETRSGISQSELRASASEISPPDLDRSIEQILSRREFKWRLPREKPTDDNREKGFFASFMDGLVETLRSWAKAIGSAVKSVVRWVADVFDWLRERIFGTRARAQAGGGAGTDWMISLQGLIFVLLVLVACAVAVLFCRTWRRRGLHKDIASEAVVPVPDVADENVTASQLPEDDWLRLAREWMGQGELRLALRAYYLAGLAHLAQREMIRVAKFKSNRDYEQELRRRARALPELQAAFAENVGIFDRVWYGLHDVTHEALQRFQTNLEKIKAC